MASPIYRKKARATQVTALLENMFVVSDLYLPKYILDRYCLRPEWFSPTVQIKQVCGSTSATYG